MDVVATKIISTLGDEDVNTTVTTEFQWEVHSLQAMLKASLHKIFPVGVKGIASPRFKIEGTIHSASLWIEGNVLRRGEPYKISISSDACIHGELTLSSAGNELKAPALLPEGERTNTLCTIRSDLAIYAAIESSDRLCIVARLKPLPRAKVVDTTVVQSPQEVVAPSSLCEVLSNALSSPELQELADVELVSSDGQTFHAHRQLLAMRSSVFRTTFYCGKLESQSSRINLEASGGAVKTLLQYIYTDDVDFDTSGSRAGELLDLATKFQLKRLVALIHKHLLLTMSIDNVTERLLLSIRYSVDQLQKDSVKVVKQNLAAVMASEGWSSISNSVEAMKLLFSPVQEPKCSATLVEEYLESAKKRARLYEHLPGFP